MEIPEPKENRIDSGLNVELKQQKKSLENGGCDGNGGVDASGGATRRNHPFPWLDAAISEPFYFLHLVAFFSYFAAHSTALSAEDGGELHGRLLRRVNFVDPCVGDRIICLVIWMCWLMRIGFCVCASAGDPGGARVPCSLHSQGAMVNRENNIPIKLLHEKCTGI
jgi:hypothetical protein